MITFSNNPQTAEKQMQAIIFYLTTFGYIDGDFDESERAFVADYIEKLVTHRVESALPEGEEALKKELTAKYTTHFNEEFERIDRYIQEMFAETTATDEDQQTFVLSRLKLRCFEIFQSFEGSGQEELMEIVDELLMADGVAHPSEVKFRAELAELLEEDLGVELIEEGEKASLAVSSVPPPPIVEYNHPFFSQFEYHYSNEHDTLLAQLESDRALIEKTMALFDSQRARGAGKLAGTTNIRRFEGQPQFLDGHVYVVPYNPDKEYDITVLGDLHGCYSCLKAAVMQSRFFEKVAAFKADPENTPEPKLVLLGDYIDRGLFSLNGVLRTVMQLYNLAPEFVYMLRGNHEMYFEYKGQVYGGVKPAEAINSLKPHVGADSLRHYINFFESMPNMLFLGEVLFVHGGIPKDLTLKEKYKDLSSLNDTQIRFEMMWSDPSMADIVPAKLQQQSVRFPFGKLQAAAFLQRMGAHTIVRGHEKVLDGFDHTYDEDIAQMFTLFSCGGIDNNDLPEKSGFRKITPMAISMTVKGSDVSLSSWKIDYKPYNDSDKNAFFKVAPTLEHVTN
ncbi:MAG: serine/threonine protein phosphatase [Deltaproteobacteria bacterium]|nr:serine/threonine protein phosphatase [Deltaproteobacteria bacterium]MBN2673619.1 serine/threonine protein phosphatase [Deltaproteobacteria bacterium]